MSDNEDNMLVLVELSGVVEKDWTSKIGSTCKFIGLSTEEPILQISNHVFTGEYKDCLGTKVLFEKKSSKESVDLCYFGNTHKVLDMHRVFISEKSSEESANSVPLSTDQETDQATVVMEKESTSDHELTVTQTTENER